MKLKWTNWKWTTVNNLTHLSILNSLCLSKCAVVLFQLDNIFSFNLPLYMCAFALPHLLNEVKVDNTVSLAVFTSRDDKWIGEGRDDDTEERWKGKREHCFCPKVTGRGIGGSRVVICRLNVIKKWVKISRGFTKCCLWYNCMCKLS